MSQVGKLTILIEAQTAKFESDLGKVKDQLAGLKGSAGEADHAFNFSEARGSLMLVEDAVGVRLPRHLNSLIAQIPGVGAAFAAMLPLAGVAVAIDIIGKLIEKHEALLNATRKAGEETAMEAGKNADLAKSLELTGLKLDDQIAKLEHKPAHNYMAEAIRETALEVDKLAAEYATEFQKINSTLEEHLGLAHRVGRAIYDAFSGEGQGHGYGVETQLLNDLGTALGNVGDKTEKLRETPADDKDGRAKAVQELVAAYRQQVAAAEALVPWQKQGSKAWLEYKENANDAKSAIENLNATLANGQKTATIGGLDQLAENIKANLIPYFGQFIQQQVESGHYASAAAEEFAQKWKAGFEKQLEEGQKAAQKLKRVWADIAEEQIKKQEEADKISEEGQKENSEQLRAVWSRDTAINLQNFKDMVAQMKVEQNKLASDAETKNAGKSGLGLDEAKLQEDAELLAQIKSQKVDLEAENKRLQADEGLLAPSDTDNINKYKAAIAELTEKLSELRKEQAKVQADTVNLGNTWQSYFQRMRGSTVDLSTTIRTNLQGAVTQFNQGFANSISQSIVEGKNFAQSMRQVAAQILSTFIESFIKMGLQHLETTLFMTSTTRIGAAQQVAANQAADTASQLSAAKVAAAKAYSALAGIPIVGPELGAIAAIGAFATALSFEQGGKIPGTGAVPIIGHSGETVVTKALTDRVERSEANGNNGGSHIHMTFAPQIHAVDAEGVDRMLTKHQTVFQRHVASAARRMNR